MKKFLVSALLVCSVAGGTLFVSAAAFANLDVSLPTTASVITAKTPTTFSAVYTNKGSETSFSENIFFDIRPSPYAFTGISLTSQTTISPLGVGHSTTGSRTYTFPSAGTYSVRACYGDYPSSFFEQRTGFRSEYDYPCGPAKTITVSGQLDTNTTNPLPPVIGALVQGYQNFCFINYTQTQCNIYIGWDLGGLPEGGQAGAWTNGNTLFSNQSRVFKLTTVSGDGATFYLKDASGNIVSSVYARAVCMDYGYKWINGACRQPATGSIKVNGSQYNGTTCNILDGESRCSVTVSYMTELASNASVWTADGVGNPATGISNSGFTWGWATVNPIGKKQSSNVLSLYEGTTPSGKVLDTIEFEGRCGFGSEWIIDKCLPATSNMIQAGNAYSFSNYDTSCVIPVGGSACSDVRIKWATVYPSASAWLFYGNEQPRKLSSSASGLITIPSSVAPLGARVGVNTFKLLQGTESTGAVIDTVTVTASCASGSSLNNEVCVSTTGSTDPDLTASAVTPTTATGSIETTFSSVINNIGAGSAAVTNISSSLIVRFEMAKDAQGQDTLNMPYKFHYIRQAMAAGTSYTAQAKFTISSGVTTYIRACVDVYGAIAESNETNNCGPWTAITGSGGQQATDLTASAVTPITTTAPTGNIKANNIDSGATCTIPSGGGVCSSGTISWTTQNAMNASVWINGNSSPASGLSGSFSPLELSYGANTFELRNGVNNTGTLLDTVTISGVCTTGTSWSSGACQPTTTTTVISNEKPDLVVGTVTPTSLTAGVMTNFQATVSNNGLAGTVNGINVLLQKASSANGTGAMDLRYAYISSLAAGASRVANNSVSLEVGSVYLRACADRSSIADMGKILESNENNNCGPWTAVTISSNTNTSNTNTTNNSPSTETADTTADTTSRSSLSGTIVASQNPCTIASGQSKCTSTITWSTANGTSGGQSGVWISGLLFSSNLSGSQTAPWITKEGGTFYLKDANGLTVASLFVSGTCTSGTEWNGTLCSPVTTTQTDTVTTQSSEADTATISTTPTANVDHNQAQTSTSATTASTNTASQQTSTTYTGNTSSSGVGSTVTQTTAATQKQNRPTVTLRINGDNVRNGGRVRPKEQPLRFDWRATNATSCHFKNESLDASGAREFTNLTSGTYNFTCRGLGGATEIKFTLIIPAVRGASTTCTDIRYNLHRGHESPNVTRLQTFLQSEGLMNEVTGFYGDKTVSAVKSYQNARGLPMTGMVYGFTRAAIKADSCQ